LKVGLNFPLSRRSLRWGNIFVFEVVSFRPFWRLGLVGFGLEVGDVGEVLDAGLIHYLISSFKNLSFYSFEVVCEIVREAAFIVVNASQRLLVLLVLVEDVLQQARAN
jgi:hypothetical protein